jgi:hypothetical protein
MSEIIVTVTHTVKLSPFINCVTLQVTCTRCGKTKSVDITTTGLSASRYFGCLTCDYSEFHMVYFTYM